MTPQSFPKSVEKITIFEAGQGGEKTPTVFFASKSSKSGSKALRPIERMLRRALEAQQTMVTTYLASHNESKAEAKDGWLKDMGNNVYKAVRKAGKKIRKDVDEMTSM